MFRARSLTMLLALLTFVSALAATPAAHAQQQTQTPSPTHASATSSFNLSGTGTPWGTRMEHWLAAGLGITLGAACVAIGTGLSRYAVDTNTHALQPTTTQSDAAASANTARDFMLAAEVMWTVGAALAGIGLTWVIVLSFSTPVQTADPAPASPSASLRLTPAGISLEGTF